ncbi:12561_t:CDS:2 [Acaulospora colombiana]|uniref:12561_t:CDS:1 n=1 Tax=Acaulospora colombiana TaxID=27376 RepID=A0ACA9K377_9GLOM|nr:12561_t:CDS:2 [Acaulospora colombiana]
MGTIVVDVHAGPSKNHGKTPHHHEIKQIICSPGIKYIATLSREDMRIVIWSVEEEERRPKPSEIFEFRELDEWANFPAFDALSFYFEFLSLHEISDGKLLIVDSRPDTAYEMFDVVRKQHVTVPTQEHKGGWHFLKDGHFVTYNEYELCLYTIVNGYSETFLMLEHVIVNSQPTLTRIITPQGKLIQVDNSHYLSLWDIRTAVLEQQFDDRNYRHLIKVDINDDSTLIAFNRMKDGKNGELTMYSTKTGMQLSSHSSKGEFIDIHFGVMHQDWLVVPRYDTKGNDNDNPYDSKPIIGLLIMNPYAMDESVEVPFDSISGSRGLDPKLVKGDKLIGVVEGLPQVEDIFTEKVSGNLRFNTHFMIKEIEPIVSEIRHGPDSRNEEHIGKRIKWSIRTPDDVENAPPIVSAFKLDDTTQSWNPFGSPLIIEIEDYELLLYIHLSSRILPNDDLIISTHALTMVFTVDPEGNIRMVYSWNTPDDLIGFADRIDYFENIMERENLVMKYQDGRTIQPFKEMINVFLTDIPTFSSYSHAILRASLKLNKDEIVEHIVDKSLQHFFENRQNINSLSMVTRSFSEIFKFNSDYTSRIIAAINKTKTERQSSEPFLNGYTYDNDLRLLSFSSRISLLWYDLVLILSPYRWFLLIYRVFFKETRTAKPSTEFIIPLPKFASYPGECDPLREVVWRPESNQFVKFRDPEFYEDWNGEPPNPPTLTFPLTKYFYYGFQSYWVSHN